LILYKSKQRKDKVLSYDKCNNGTKTYGDQQHSYSFPHGYGFGHVACPHYLSENSMYCRFWLLAPTSLSLFSLLFWVVANQSVVANSHYDWYKEYFTEEFKLKAKNGWKRLIPMV
jgi:hypothetical protein